MLPSFLSFFPTRHLPSLASSWSLELVELTAPVLRPLDIQCPDANACVKEGVPTNCNNKSVQVEMVEQDNRYMILDNVDFEEVPRSVTYFN